MTPAPVIHGCDLNSRKIAIVTYGQDGVIASTVIAIEAKVRDRGQICGELWRQFAAYSKQHSGEPIFIEEPLVGRNVKASLMIAQVYGVVLAAAENAGMSAYPAHVQTWKREVIGNGSASKDMVADYLRNSYPDVHTLCGGDQDLVDAACIALYGRECVRRSVLR